MTLALDINITTLKLLATRMQDDSSLSVQEGYKLAVSVLANIRGENPTATGDVLQERHRQVAKEGFDAAHDDDHRGGELARAAATYAMLSVLGSAPASPEFRAVIDALWPSGWVRRRLQSRRRNLVIAAALLLAEIERLDRETAREAAFRERHKPGLGR